MANDAASSMSNLTAIPPGVGAPPRQVGLPVRDTTSGTVITAEIPAVPAGPSYGVLLPDGSVWYPGSRRRLPAPLILRVIVWILAFAVFFAVAGDFIIRYHPSWVEPLRHIVPARSATASGATVNKPASAGSKNGGAGPTPAVALMTPQPQGLPWSPLTGYRVTRSTYTVTVTAGSYPAWVSGQAYASNQLTGGLMAQTLQAGKFLALPATGELLVHIGAGGTTIRVYHGGTLLATVPTPAHCPCYLFFEPTGR